MITVPIHFFKWLGFTFEPKTNYSRCSRKRESLRKKASKFPPPPSISAQCSMPLWVWENCLAPHCQWTTDHEHLPRSNEAEHRKIWLCKHSFWPLSKEPLEWFCGAKRPLGKEGGSSGGGRRRGGKYCSRANRVFNASRKQQIWGKKASSSLFPCFIEEGCCVTLKYEWSWSYRA